MRDIAIYGAGGLGKEVAGLVRRINASRKELEWNLIGFFDDGKDKGEQISHFGKCLGNMSDLNGWTSQLAVVLAIGNSLTVRNLIEKINNPSIFFPNLISPGFWVSDPESFTIGKGNIIQGGCRATVDVSIGDFNLLNGDVVVGHDVSIGSFNTIMPAVRISGEVVIGDNNFLGVGSIVLQQIRIGNNVRLGAGSVLMTKPKDGNLYMGNPARMTVY